MSIRVAVQLAPDVAARKSYKIPAPREFRAWVRAALKQIHRDAEVALRVVGEDESAYFNKTFRRKRGPTNVLSFPAQLSPDIPEPLLGDLVICAPVVAREAREQRKPIIAHWAHMTVHGTLHLVGFDHQTKRDAQKMEALEVVILSKLGFRDPYIDER